MRQGKWPRLTGVLLSLGAVVGLGLAIHSGFVPALAQDAGLTTAPIDENAPDVVAFRNRSSEAPSGVHAEALKLGLPPDQFFASLDPSAPGALGEAPVPKRFTEEKCEVELVDWDRTDLRGWFRQNYGPPCNLSLHCLWIEDAASRAGAAVIAEQELETREAAESGDDEEPVAGAAEVFNPEDEHLVGYPEISIKVTLAGRRDCRLTRYCDGHDDPNCNEEYLNFRASQISIDQLGK